MTKSLLCLNPSKTEFLIIGFREQLSKLTYFSDLYLQQITHLQHLTRLQSETLESSLIKSLPLPTTSPSYLEPAICIFRDLRRLRPILAYKTACRIATSIVHSK